jgi:hypothetical protein
MRGGGYSPFLQQDSGQIFKDDVEGFFSPSRIFSSQVTSIKPKKNYL